ncbi:hypothetical protein CDAR_435821 [Caerostris darwini]|uniref:Uncharacterized protein n=1 Tax=Caerostris darwini TaxID=1538125 RepID=A0AAV4PP17_9ARAC|nr:hypothetical protein CDAR_435821 [Caerostris darwini]
MHILQVFVLLCGLKKVFEQRIPDDWRKTGIIHFSTDQNYLNYMNKCYPNFMDPTSIDFVCSERPTNYFGYLEQAFDHLPLWICLSFFIWTTLSLKRMVLFLNLCQLLEAIDCLDFKFLQNCS